MKKIIAVLAAAAILFACGCTLQVDIGGTTEPVSELSTTAPQLEDDLALPAVNDSGTTTAPVIAPTTQPTTAFQQAPILRALEQAQTAVTTTAAPEPEPTTPAPVEQQDPEQTEPATEKPTETTTEAPKTAELLQSAVLAPINSGTYTETISASGKDQSPDDKLYKIVRGGETAYWITIPDAQLSFKVFPMDGKYYMATSSKYCELTKAQYDSVCKSFGNAFCNFSALQYQKTETVREKLKKYTCETFDFSGSTLVLWYQNGNLVKIQMGEEFLPMTVSSGASDAYFTLDPTLEQSDYETMKSLASLAEAFFG